LIHISDKLLAGNRILEGKTVKTFPKLVAFHQIKGAKSTSVDVASQIGIG
jgi:hypothetical protein